MELAVIAPADARASPGRPPFIRDLGRYLGARIELRGWVSAIRHTKTMSFLVVRDRTGDVQIICKGSQAGAARELPTESAVSVSGVVRRTSDRRYGEFEIESDAITPVSVAVMHAQGPTTVNADRWMDRRYLDLRRRERNLVLEVRSTLETALRNYLLDLDFIELHTPKIAACGSESGAAVFTLPYFGSTACLVQSPQFYMQMAMAASLDRVFEFGPVFRAEHAVTNRHATEFTCLDVEMSWIESHAQLMDVLEELVRYATQVVEGEHGRDIQRWLNLSIEIPVQKIRRLPIYTAEGLPGVTRGIGGARITHEAEQALTKVVRQSSGQAIVFVTDYPAGERPFYTMRSFADAQDSTTRSFDLLWSGVEIASGCQREHRYVELERQMRERLSAPAADSGYLRSHYLEMFRHGCPPHGGFGLGIERLMMVMLAQQSVRDTAFAHRGPDRFVP